MRTIQRTDLGEQESRRAQTPGGSCNQYPNGIVLVPFTEEFVDQPWLGSFCVLLGSVIGGFEDLLVDGHYFWVVSGPGIVCCSEI